jgi:glycine/D-amino acid oxidase-like deaminating enzyme
VPLSHAINCCRIVESPEEAPSYWLMDAHARHPSYSERLPSEVEVIVIGGGAIGVAATYWLARQDVAVLMLDSFLLAHGASGRNAGLLLFACNGLESPDLIRSVLKEEGIDAQHKVCGHLALASSQSVADRIQDEVAKRPTWAEPLHFLNRTECEDLLRMRVSQRFCGGRWLPSGAAIHPVRFVYGLAAAAIRHGASVGVMAQALELIRLPSDDRVEVKTTRGILRARRVLVACNVRTGVLLPGLERFFRPTRGQVLCTQPLSQIFRIGLAVDWGNLYWRQAKDGVIVLGGYYNMDPVVESTSLESLNPGIQGALDRFLPEAFPDFPPFSVAKRWAGIMDETVDGKPVVGRWPPGGNVWVAAGFGGHGLPPALGVGRELANSIVRDKLSSQLEPFDPVRFGTSRPSPCAESS